MTTGADVGGNTLTVDDVSRYSVGETIIIELDTVLFDSQFVQALITQIDGTTLTFYPRLPRSVSVANTVGPGPIIPGVVVPIDNPPFTGKHEWKASVLATWQPRPYQTPELPPYQRKLTPPGVDNPIFGRASVLSRNIIRQAWEPPSPEPLTKRRPTTNVIIGVPVDNPPRTDRQAKMDQVLRMWYDWYQDQDNMPIID